MWFLAPQQLTAVLGAARRGAVYHGCSPWLFAVEQLLEDLPGPPRNT